jgi:hypothetical protein
MGDNKIHELIKELKVLKLRETEIIAQLEVENVRRNRETRENRAQVVRHRTTTTTTNHGFERGDRIRITNQVTKPAHWDTNETWNYRDALRATVTFTTADRIYFVTDNGVNTWRAVRNIKRL